MPPQDGWALPMGKWVNLGISCRHFEGLGNFWVRSYRFGLAITSTRPDTQAVALGEVMEVDGEGRGLFSPPMRKRDVRLEIG